MMKALLLLLLLLLCGGGATFSVASTKNTAEPAAQQNSSNTETPFPTSEAPAQVRSLRTLDPDMPLPEDEQPPNQKESHFPKMILNEKLDYSVRARVSADMWMPSPVKKSMPPAHLSVVNDTEPHQKPLENYNKYQWARIPVPGRVELKTMPGARKFGLLEAYEELRRQKIATVRAGLANVTRTLNLNPSFLQDNEESHTLQRTQDLPADERDDLQEDQGQQKKKKAQTKLKRKQIKKKRWALRCPSLVDKPFFRDVYIAAYLASAAYQPWQVGAVIQVPDTDVQAIVREFRSANDMTIAWIDWYLSIPMVFSTYKDTLFISIRGSHTAADFLNEIKAALIPFELSVTNQTYGYVHAGFLKAYLRTVWFMKSVRKILTQHILPQHSEPKIIFTGHGMGGAIAQLLAMETALTPVSTSIGPIRPQVFSFGAPRVGDDEWKANFGKYVYHFRFENDVDFVPETPQTGPRDSIYDWHFYWHAADVSIQLVLPKKNDLKSHYQCIDEATDNWSDAVGAKYHTPTLDAMMEEHSLVHFYLPRLTEIYHKAFPEVLLKNVQQEPVQDHLEHPVPKSP